MYTILPQSAEASVGIRISGKLTTEQERELIQKADAIVAEHGAINLLVELLDFEGATAEAVAKDLKWIAQNLNNLARLAVVADSKVLGWLIDADAVFAKLVGIEEKHFSRDEIAEAWAWLKRQGQR
ncbi:MAG: STAS/SEC14 domain-containing protein [Alteraurantiacibacter sp.]